MKRLIGIKEVQKYETAILKEIDRIFKFHQIVYYMGYGSLLGAVRHKGPIPWDTDMDILIPYSQFETAVYILKKELPKEYIIDDPSNTKGYNLLFPRVGLRNNSSLYLHVDIFPLVGVPDKKIAQIKYHKKSTIYNVTYEYKHKKSNSKKIYKRWVVKILNYLLAFIPKKPYINLFKKHCGQYSYEKSNFVMNPCGHYGMKNVLEKRIFGNPKYLIYDGIFVPVPEEYEYYLKHYYGDYMSLPSKDVQLKGLQFTMEINENIKNVE